jgi:heme/copper-type cytochrome/quinol oxidase subunit 3
MLIFVITEAMFFAGLVSAHTIAKSSSPLGWPPPGQPRLPVTETALNTAVLLVSGFWLLRAGQRHRQQRRDALAPLTLAALFGALFVLAQGAEWVGLLRAGLTLTSSTHGSFFYMIVGTHALHALVALGALLWALRELQRGRLTDAAFTVVRVFWLFVVGVWPFLYWKVYL